MRMLTKIAEVYRGVDKNLPHWKKVLTLKAGLLTGLYFASTGTPLVGTEGNDIRRYNSRDLFSSEPIVAQVRLDEDKNIVSLRTYRGKNGELLFVSTTDYDNDGSQNYLRITATTGNRFRDRRKILYNDEFATSNGIFVPTGDSKGELTGEGLLDIFPDIQKHAIDNQLDLKSLAESVKNEAYRLTEANKDSRFQIKEK